MMKKIPQEIRDAVVKRDKALVGGCRHCKAHLREGQGHIHHLWGRQILPPKWSGIKESNDLRNLVYLCPMCHNRIHSPLPKDVEHWKRWREEALKINIEFKGTK